MKLFMNHRNLLFVVLHPGVKNFAEDYFRSINSQSYLNFDLLVINDGLKYSGFNYKGNVIVIDSDSGMTPAQIRYMGLRYASEHSYERIVFSDADDFYSTNRMQLILNQLKDSDFVFNRIIPVDEAGGQLLPDALSLIPIPLEISSYNTILDYNLIGLGNSGVSIEAIRNLNIPSSIRAVDWWLFTILLLQGNEGRYINDCITYYRQTTNNLVGFNRELTEKRLMIGVMIKSEHYHQVAQYCKSNGENEAWNIYNYKRMEMAELTKAIENDSFRSKYIQIINQNMHLIYQGWWSEILPLERWFEYE